MACDAIILKFFRIGEFAAHLNFTRLDKLNSKLPHRRYMIRKKNA
jgi:hypothetical protein